MNTLFVLLTAGFLGLGHGGGGGHPGKVHSTNPAYDVYVRGQYVGSDPDPRIRQELIRDWGGNNQ